ncbi:MAG: insulinase family protein [Verrucomicrobia bacterium]|nr:insulinase family protein [Verrucomicrobiota bacterium]MBU1734713.1 insulinase family protein [Verrucomicrobiota bacterium]MBU1857204.1 insulinase family protein [Verrucomicrobiota bacterium]
MQTLRSWFGVRSLLRSWSYAGQAVVCRLLTLTFCILHFAFCISACATVQAEAALDQVATGVNRFVLDNGLIVLTREDASAPVVSIQIWVGAGAVHEQEFLGGGLSHLIEHMIFKGTPKRPPGDISRTINDLGGTINAYTSLDRTVFLVDIPSAHWSTGLAVLADAVMNASFPDDEWRREKDVIRREMAMGKDNPERRVSELLCQTAYSAHPYRVPVIGYEDIFKTLTRADLLAFFRRHYMPNNMIVSIVGDVRGADVRAEVQKQFADYPRRAYPPVVLPSEPKQIGLRTARQTGAWTVARLEWAWHTVPLSHPDAPALDLLAAIVGQGRSSRLVHAIKENQKLVSQIEAWSFTPREAGLFGISAVFDPTNEPALALALEGEIARWTTTPFSPEEIEKARRQMLTGTLSAFQTMHGQADQFASGEFYTGTPAFFQVYLRRLRDVTPVSLAGVVRRYLTPDNLTKAVLLPAEAGRRTADDRPEDGGQRSEVRNQQTSNIQHRTSNAEGLKIDAGPNAEHRTPNTDVQKTILASGLVLLTRADHKLPFVDFQVACGGGLLFENESNNGISSLMAELMTRGTARRSAQKIAGVVESRGGSLAAFAGQNSCGLKARCLKEDAGTFMDLLADCLLNPAFATDEVAKQKTIQLAAIKQQRESPMFLAQEALRQVLFPGHPYRFSPEGTFPSVQALSQQALRDYHAKTVVSGNAVLAIFGDITADDARALAERFLDRFPARVRPALEHKASQPILPQQVTRTVPKAQTIILTGFPGIDLKDPRRDALDILQKAMNGLSSDLMIRIRDEQGLVYYTGVMQRAGLEPGFLALYAGTHTGAVDRVQGLMQDEVRRVTTQGLRVEEFERARAQLIADHQQSLQLNGEIALECALNELYGLGYGYSFTLEQRLRALTPEDVRRAAATLLTPEKCVNVVVRPDKSNAELRMQNAE